VLRIASAVLPESFEILRSCGAGRAECVVYWLGRRTNDALVDEVVHPKHSSHAGGYDVDGAWQNQLWLRMAREDRRLLAQVHTHPAAAYHSQRDDAMAALQTPGFLSLVVPEFALGEVSLRGTHLAERVGDGGWIALDAVKKIAVEGGF